MIHWVATKARLRGAVAIIMFAGAFLHDTRPSAAAAAAVAVEWTHLVKATAAAGSVKKSGGCNGCSDAGATSAQTITTTDGYVEFTAVAGRRVYAGLGTNATSNTDPALINYAFSLWEDGGWDVRERNVYKTDGWFVTGDRFRIAVTAGVVKYYKNGALVYTSATRATASLLFDTTLVGSGAEVRNATITAASTTPPPPVISPVTITTAALPGGAVSQAYADTLQASGGHGTFVWSAAGALPTGLTLASSGAISGVASKTGHFTFTAHAADAADTGNFADRSLSIDIIAPTTLTIVTTSLPVARVDDFYTTSLRASGGSGVYRWSLASGALPSGVSLDAASGAIQGTPSSGGRFRVTVQATDGGTSVGIGDRALVLTVRAAAPPSVYSAITDRVTRTKGPTPALGGAGYAFTDPAFGSRLVRITDGALQPSEPNISYRTPSGTHTNAWSADARYFYTVDTYGTVIPFAFDRATMRATRLQPSATGDGGLTLEFFNEPTFSYLTPGVMYATYNGPGSNLRSVDQYDFDTGQYSQLVNLDSLVPNLANTYAGGLGASAGAVERIMTFFGGASQDEHFYLLVFDKDDPSRRHLLNTRASTIDGQSANTPLNFNIHAAAIDRSGEFVVVYPTADDLGAPRYAPPAYVWDLVTNRLTALPLIPAITGGHDGYGYGVRVNQDCCTKTTWDAAQWQFRTLINPFVTFDLITDVLLPKEVYLEDHPSWHNAQPDRLVPFIDANYRQGDDTTPWRAWDEEVFAVQTEGAGSGGSVWRFAHHRSIVASDVNPLDISFWNTPRANVSPDGRWALFTSNWDKTLGIDPRNDPDGRHRQDVFLVQLVK